MLPVFLFVTLPQAAPAASPQQSADEIVVVGQRLKNWAGKFTVRGGKSTCRTSRSTGDVEIDAIGCQAMTSCLPPLQSRIDASDAKGIDRNVRKQMKAALGRDLGTCVRDRHEVLVTQLVERRFEAHQETTNAQD